MNPAKVIKYLRKQIPIFKCVPGCHACCGPVPFSRWEWDRVVDKRKALDLSCPYISEEGCAIYSQRPIMCRLFGAVPEMKCLHGCTPLKMLSSEKGRKLLVVYKSLIEMGL